MRRLKLDIVLNLEIMLYWGNYKVYGSQLTKTELKEFLKMSGSYSKISLIENMPLFYESLRKKKCQLQTIVSKTHLDFRDVATSFKKCYRTDEIMDYKILYLFVFFIYFYVSLRKTRVIFLVRAD